MSLRSIALLASTALALACTDATGPVQGALAIIEQPDAAVVGVPVGSLRMRVVDEQGAVISSARGVVTVALVGGSGQTLGGDVSVPLIGGVADFARLEIRGPVADVTLRATWERRQVTLIPIHLYADWDLIATDGPSGERTAVLLSSAVTSPTTFSPLRSDDAGARLIHGAGAGDVTVFQRGRAPALVAPMSWTDAPDTLRVALAPALRIPITVWAIADPLDAVRSSIADEITRVDREWFAEGVGLAVGDVEYVDASASPDAGRFLNWIFNANEVETLIGHRAGRMNVYLVGAQTLQAGQAQTPNLGIAVMGGNTLTLGRSAARALGHELGHNFGLLHLDPAVVGSRNVMAPGQKFDLDTFTEGQIFRMHFSAQSALTSVFGYNAALKRDCPEFATAAPCPSENLMVWSDLSP